MATIFQKLAYEQSKRRRRLAEAKAELLVCLVQFKVARLVSRLTALANLPKLRSKLQLP